MFTMMARISSQSSSLSSSPNSSLSLSPTGWTPSRAAVSPAITTTAASTSPDVGGFSFATVAKRSGMSRRRSCSLSPPPTSLDTTPSHHACAYPAWPARDSLATSRDGSPASPCSPVDSAAAQHFAIPSSRISDDDLLALDFDLAAEAMAATALGISWSQVGAGARALEEVPQLMVREERRRRLPPPPQQQVVVRHRSTSRGVKARAGRRSLGAIAE